MPNISLWQFLSVLAAAAFVGVSLQRYFKRLVDNFPPELLPPKTTPAPAPRRHWLVSFRRIYRAAKPKRPRFRTPTREEKFSTLGAMAGAAIAGSVMTYSVYANVPPIWRLSYLFAAFLFFAICYFIFLYVDDEPSKIPSYDDEPPSSDNDLSKVAKELADEYRRK